MSKLAHSNQATMDEIERRAESEPDEDSVFIHTTPKDTCDHDFGGWRMHADGRGGEQFCRKCGMGAMEHTLRNDPF